MKKLKNIAFIVIVLFFGMAEIYAQEKSIIIRGSFNVYNIEITTIQTDYQVLKQEYRTKEDPENYFLIHLKMEIDKWLKEGYTLTTSGVSTTSPIVYKMFYVLTKKE